MDSQPRVIKASGPAFSPFISNATEKGKIIPNWKDYEVSESPRGTDVGAPELNAEWPGELDTEEYRDPLGEDESND